MAKPALLMTGPMMPLIARGCEDAFLVHRLWEARDREALLRKVAPEIRAICTGGHTGVRVDDAFMGALSQSQDRRQFRRRLRFGRRGRGGKARRGRHQHPRGADRGGRGHDAGASAQHRARVLPGREVAARRPLGEGGRLPAHARVPARPLRRHRRAGAHRQGHRAPAGGLRPARQLLRPQPAGGCRLPPLRRSRGPGARCRYADRGHARGAGDAEPHRRRGAGGARARAASSSTSRADRWWTKGR